MSKRAGKLASETARADAAEAGKASADAACEELRAELATAKEVARGEVARYTVRARAHADVLQDFLSHLPDVTTELAD